MEGSREEAGRWWSLEGGCRVVQEGSDGASNGGVKWKAVDACDDGAEKGDCHGQSLSSVLALFLGLDWI